MGKTCFEALSISLDISFDRARRTVEKELAVSTKNEIHTPENKKGNRETKQNFHNYL